MKIISNDELKCQIAQDALKTVIDPEIGLNIVDLGLIYEINFDLSKQMILLRMTLTTQFCPMGESITDAAKQILESTFTGYETKLELSYNPAWNIEFLSEEGKRFLGR